MQIDADQIIKDALASNTEGRRLTQLKLEELAKGKKFADRAAENTVLAAELQADVEVTRDLALEQANQSSINNANALGSNSLDANEIITQLSTQMRNSAAGLKAARDKVNDIERDSDLLSNPAGWLKDLLVGDEARAELGDLKEAFEDNATILRTMHELTQADSVTQRALAKTSTAASIKKAAEGKVALANAQADQIRMQSTQFSIEGIESLHRDNATEYNNKVRAYNTARQQQNHNESLAFQRKKFQFQVDQVEGDEAEQQYILETINVGRAAMKLEPLSEAAVKLSYGTRTGLGEMLDYFAVTGQQVRDTGSAHIGMTPAGSIAALRKYGGSFESLDPVTAELLLAAESDMIKIANELSTSTFPKGDDRNTYGLTRENANDPEVLLNAIDASYAVKQKAEDDKFPEQALDFTAFIDEFENFKDTIVYKKILQPLEASGITTISPKEIALRGAELFVQGEDNSSDIANDVVAVVQQMRAYVTALSGRTAIGAVLADPFTIAVELPYKGEIATGAEQRRNVQTAIGASVLTGPIGSLIATPTLPSFTEIKNFFTGVESELVNVYDVTDYTHYLAKYKAKDKSAKMREKANAN